MSDILSKREPSVLAVGLREKMVGVFGIKGVDFDVFCCDGLNASGIELCDAMSLNVKLGELVLCVGLDSVKAEDVVVVRCRWRYLGMHDILKCEVKIVDSFSVGENRLYHVGVFYGFGVEQRVFRSFDNGWFTYYFFASEEFVSKFG